MPTRNAVLTNHQAAYVEDLVSSGRYQTVSEMPRDGLRLIEPREANASRLEALRSAVRVGFADFDAGRFSVFDSSDALGAHLKSVAGKAVTPEILTLAVNGTTPAPTFAAASISDAAKSVVDSVRGMWSHKRTIDFCYAFSSSLRTSCLRKQHI